MKKDFKDVRAELLISDISKVALPCHVREVCPADGIGCDQLLAENCPIAAEQPFLPNFASCPFISSGKFVQSLEQLAEIQCKDCRACEGEKPLKICAICRSLHIGGKWTSQKFIGVQTTVPYVFCDKCRLQ